MGKRLILMRHAKSAWNDLTLPDHDRPLNPRGERGALALGRWLRVGGYLPDQALVSTARRTVETFVGLSLPLQPVLDPRLYLADEAQLLACLREARGDCVLLIAHNPGIGALAGDLLRAPVANPRFHDYPTGATLVAEFPTERWDLLDPGTGTALDFALPRDLTD